mgnify:CR=1 FL=1
MIGRNDACWCGSEKKWKKCHYPALSPTAFSQKELAQQYWKQHHILLKNEEQIKGIRASCKLAAFILDTVCNHAKIGTTTEELNQLAMELHKQAGAIAAPLNYGQPPFPKSICTSLNDVICHGIPNEEPLKKGDILNIDVTCILSGYYGDCSRMIMVGEVSEEKKRVVDVSYECLMQSIAILKPGLPLCEIGEVIEQHAHHKGCSVVYQFVGHGVGIKFHENPQILHHRNQNKLPLAPGMIFTIEPMINAGVAEAVIDSTDQWTARTQDGRASAQWEHTLLITANGYEILTPWQR